VSILLESHEHHAVRYKYLSVLPVAQLKLGKVGYRMIGRKIVEQLEARLSLQEVAMILGILVEGVRNIELVALGKVAVKLRELEE